MSTKHRSIHDTPMCLRSDSYKYSHSAQLPPGTTNIYSYMESRGGLFNETVFFGLKYYLKEYLSRQITMEDVDRAEQRIDLHMGPGIFNRPLWERIVKVHNGYLPIKIKAVPEGMVIPTHNVLMTVENTDPELPSATNFAETLLLKVWYPITVATLSREIKKVILGHLERTGTPSAIDFKLHDFGYRGVSSEESAAIGGMAHLVNFKGSDTVLALEAAEIYYSELMAGFSIAAAEHSTVTAWGLEFEYEAYENMIKQFGNRDIYAVVSDSKNIFNACEHIWGEQLYTQVMAAPGVLVIRPDSGVPHEVVLQITEILGRKFGFAVNEKGYKVLNKVRVIQGDGITMDEIELILSELEKHGWSADNVGFGMGGALLQQVNRDTQKFAFKASSIIRNGRMKDVYKEPVTDPGKNSKRGRLKLIYRYGEVGDEVITVSKDVPGQDILQLVWDTGKLLVDDDFSVVRARAKVVSEILASVV